MGSKLYYIVRKITFWIIVLIIWPVAMLHGEKIDLAEARSVWNISFDSSYLQRTNSYK